MNYGDARRLAEWLGVWQLLPIFAKESVQRRAHIHDPFLVPPTQPLPRANPPSCLAPKDVLLRCRQHRPAASHDLHVAARFCFDTFDVPFNAVWVVGRNSDAAPRLGLPNSDPELSIITDPKTWRHHCAVFGLQVVISETQIVPNYAADSWKHGYYSIGYHDVTLL